MSKKQLLAVIDLGSLSLRLKIFELSPEMAPKEIESARRYLSLGARTYRHGILSSEQVANLCEVLSGFVLKLKEYRIPKSRTICVATSAFREANNRAVVLEQIRLKTGLVVEVLDNAKERYFHNLAVKECQPHFASIIEQGTMMLDIGAGSMQATVYDHSDFVFSQNTVLGSLRISELLSDVARQTTHYAETLEEYISQDLEDYHAIEPRNISYKNLIAFGEDIGFIKDLAGMSPREYCFLSKEQFLSVYDALIKISPADLIMDKEIPKDTAPLLLPTAMMIKKMLEYTDAKGVHLPAASLTDGVMYDFAEKEMHYNLVVSPKKDLLSGARHLARRYHSDHKHTEHVENSALVIFDCTRRIHGMGEREKTMLQLAAILHEVGKYVHISNPFESTFNIICKTELVGMATADREIVAYVAFFYANPDMIHETAFQALDDEKKTLVLKLTAILRICDALDASHKQKMRNLSLTVTSDSVTISGESRLDMTYEKWVFNKQNELFFDVYAIKPILHLRRQIK